MKLNVTSRNVLKKTFIQNSVSSCSINITKILLDYDADIISIDNNRNTPLMLASTYPEIVILLLENGANTMHVNKRKETALNISISKHYSKTSSIMIP